MSYIVHRQTVGLAQDVYNDLLANMSNLRSYEDIHEYSRDMELFALLGAWLRVELQEEDELGS